MALPNVNVSSLDRALTDVQPGEADAGRPEKPRSMLRRGWEVFAENRLALISLVVLLFIV